MLRRICWIPPCRRPSLPPLRRGSCSHLRLFQHRNHPSRADRSAPFRHTWPFSCHGLEGGSGQRPLLVRLLALVAAGVFVSAFRLSLLLLGHSPVASVETHVAGGKEAKRSARPESRGPKKLPQGAAMQKAAGSRRKQAARHGQRSGICSR